MSIDDMTNLAWVELTTAEMNSLSDALASFRLAAPHRAKEIERLVARLEAASPPAITVGVYGGLVQWVQGNPFPIRIVDYDGDADELPDRDDEGHPCSIWEEPADPTPRQPASI